MTKYSATIVSVGELAQEFIAEGVMVFFATNAPEELQETAFVHDCTHEPSAPVEPGDLVILDGQSFEVLGVGDVANENLKNLGHLVLKFNGLKEPEMRGDVNLPEGEVPQIGPGSTMEIKAK